MKAILTKLSSNHDNLRTDEISGETEYCPVAGSSFVMRAPPLETGNVRVIVTSIVQEVELVGPGVWEFKTRNSHYRLRVFLN